MSFFVRLILLQHIMSSRLVHVVASSPDYFYLLFFITIYETSFSIIDSTSYCVKCELGFCVDNIFYLISFLPSACSLFFSGFDHLYLLFNQRVCFLYFLYNAKLKLYYFSEQIIFQRVLFSICPLLVLLSFSYPFYVILARISCRNPPAYHSSLDKGSFIWCSK